MWTLVYVNVYYYNNIQHSYDTAVNPTYGHPSEQSTCCNQLCIVTTKLNTQYIN